MTKLVTFEVSGEVNSYDLLLEHNESGKQQRMVFNPHTFNCDEGETYTYLFRTRAAPDTKYKIEVFNATSAITPMEGKTYPPHGLGDVSAQIIA